MISAAELASMQATANASMDQSIVIKRNTPTQGPTGHPVDNWTTVTTVNGNLAQPTGTQLQNYSELVASENTWMVRVPIGTSLRVNDRLVIGSQYMRVAAVITPQSYQIALRALANELSGVSE